MFDSSQEGTQALNTTFNGFDDTIKAPAIQAIQVAIQSIEEQVSSITGVLTQALGNIQQRDAVSNVKVGVRQSTLLTKQYFSAMDLMYKEVNYDLLNCAKVTYKKGLKGTLILGDKLIKVFNALPEYYTMTDFDIHIQDSSEVSQLKEEIKALNVELIKAQLVDADTAIDVATAKNLTDLRDKVNYALKKKKAENDQLGQLNEQVQQLDQELKQTAQEAQKLQAEVKQLNAQKLQLEKEKLDFEKQLEWYKARTDSSYKDQLIELEKRRVQLEGLQLFDDNAKNDEIRDY